MNELIIKTTVTTVVFLLCIMFVQKFSFSPTKLGQNPLTPAQLILRIVSHYLLVVNPEDEEQSIEIDHA
jgi:hypothetical protein